MKTLDQTTIHQFADHLREEEKSVATIEKYIRDVTVFQRFLGKDIISKAKVVNFKQHLVEKGYATRSINSMIASINALLVFLGLADCRAKSLRLQRETYCAEDKELSKAEYLRLLEAAEKQPQLKLVMETICATGIRVSELRYFTVEAIRQGEVVVKCKSKTRNIFIPGKLRKLLLKYAKGNGIKCGSIFLDKAGKPLNRCVIWAQMKRLCSRAGVQTSKVFPHNLRKLFARTFYGIEKDIAKLADILGHSSINTTRIYIISTGSEHRKKIERLGLVV